MTCSATDCYEDEFIDTLCEKHFHKRNAKPRTFYLEKPSMTDAEKKKVRAFLEQEENKKKIEKILKEKRSRR